jgi:hypothetical protein
MNPSAKLALTKQKQKHFLAQQNKTINMVVVWIGCTRFMRLYVV